MMPPPSLFSAQRRIGIFLAALLIAAAWLAAGWRQAETSAQAERLQRKLARIAPAQKLGRASAADQQHALEDLLAGRPFVLVADGRAQHFTLALDELLVDSGPVEDRLKKLPPQPDARHLLELVRRQGEGKARLVLYPAGRSGEPLARHFLNRRLLVQSSDRAATLAALEQHGLRLLSEPDYAPGSLIVEPISGGPEAVLQALAALAAAPGTRSVGPLLGRHRQKHLVPDDPFFSQQWHLRNTGQGGGKLGTDMRITSVWDSYLGSGIRIGIVDDGLDLLHPDLAPNVDSTNHYDWNDTPHDTNPQPLTNIDRLEEDTHGTSVGGVAAARGGNTLGVSGVAPQATLVGFRLISTQDPDGVSDEDEAEAMSRGKDVIHIKNNSWGTGAPAWVTWSSGPLMEAARQNAAETGRGGKGTVFVWSAGNGRLAGEQGQKDGATNSMYVTTVSGVDNRGNLASYSEGGSHIVVAAPTSGGSLRVVTTDLRGPGAGYNRTSNTTEPSDKDYTNSFGGTSSAAPAVSGAVALMLQANPALHWRDVKEILLRSSTQLFPADTGWVTRSGGDPTLPPIKHHEKYGGGLIDTQAAVNLTQGWPSLGPMISASRSRSNAQTIPDNNTTGISITFDFSSLGLMRVEHATLRLNAFHTYRGDLEVKLTSPTGTVSTLATEEYEDDGNDYDDWTFSSVRHWGELGAGVWTLTLKDLDSGVVGSFQSATLTLYGTDVSPAPQITSHTPGPVLLRAGDDLALTSAATGGGNLAFVWNRNGITLPGRSSTFAQSAVTTAHAGTYRVTAINAAGSSPSADISVGVVAVPAAEVTVNQAFTLTLGAPSAGPGMTYQWRRGGSPLVNGAKTTSSGVISGADSATLVITNAQADEAGAYTCVIGMAGTAQTLETSPTQVSVRFKPDFNPPAFGNGVRNSSVDLQLSASNSPTGFTATGLPPGVTLNKATGRLTGRPTRPGTYQLTLSASNAAGTGPALQHTWVVEEFPAAAVGTWQGLVARNADLNQNYGGRIKITVTSTGTCTGSLTLGSKTRSWSGFVDAVPGGGNPVTSLLLPLGSGIGPFTGSYTLDLAARTFSGSLQDARPTSVTAFSGALQAWSGKNKPVPVTTAYNTALELPGGLVGDAAYPQGSGYVVLSLSTAGIVTWAGRLAEGTSITGTSPLGPTGQTCWHAMLYSNSGSAQGWARIHLDTALTEGSLDWFKHPSTTTRSYRGGIPLHSLGLRGARYTRPPAGQMLLGLTAPASATSTTPNARLLFTGAPLAAPLAQPFQITLAAGVKMPAAGAGNPQGVRLTLAAATGLLSGGFSLKDPDPLDTTAPIATITRAATFQGLLITHPGLTQGIGWFTLPELADTPGEKNTTTPIPSGRVDLTAP